MGRLRHFFRAMWLFATHSDFCPAPEWKPEDRQALAAFLATSTGAKLRMTLTAYIAGANERAAMKATAFECGWACGYRGIWAQFEHLSQAAADSGTPEEAPDGTDADLEFLSP